MRKYKYSGIILVFSIMFLLMSAECFIMPTTPQVDIVNNVAACSTAATDIMNSHFKVRNQSGRELLLFRGNSAESVINRIPNISDDCYIRLNNIVGNTTIQLRFFDSSMFNGRDSLDPSEFDPFYNGGEHPVAPNSLRPTTFIIPQAQVRVNTGTIALRYAGEGNVSVFAVNSETGSCPANLAEFRRIENFDSITVLSSNIGTTEVTVPYEETYKFMFAYWQSETGGLNIRACSVSEQSHSLDSMTPQTTEVIPPFIPNAAATGQLVIHNDHSSPVQISVGSQLIADNANVQDTDSSTVQPGQNRTFVFNTGTYTLTARASGVFIERREITIIGAGSTTWRVNRNDSD